MQGVVEGIMPNINPMSLTATLLIVVLSSFILFLVKNYFNKNLFEKVDSINIGIAIFLAFILYYNYNYIALNSYSLITFITSFLISLFIFFKDILWMFYVIILIIKVP